MKALLWKELREKRLWLVPLVISTAGLVLLGYGYTFCGDMYSYTPLMGVSVLLALLMGTGTYSRESSGNTADFLYSRPVSWKKILLAKLVVGVGIILTAAVVAAIVYRVTVPGPYVQFATAGALLRGVGIAVLVMAVPYLLASFTSMVLPGMIGAILMLVIVSTTIGVEMFLLNTDYTRQHFCINDTGNHAPFVVILSWPVALVVAGLIVARFGFTLSTGARVLRYSLVALGIAVMLTPVDYMLKDRLYSWLFTRQEISFHISQTGSYAVALVSENLQVKHLPVMMRLKDRKRVDLPDVELAFGSWYGDKHYSIMEKRSGQNMPAQRMEIVWMNQKGNLVTKTVNLGKGWYVGIHPSPSGRYVVAGVILDKNYHGLRSLKFVDVDRGRLMDIPEIVTTPKRLSWKSDREFVYYDNKGVRHGVNMGKR